MDEITPTKALEPLKTREIKRFPRQPVEKHTGIFQHFKSEAQRQEYLQYNEQHRNELPF